MIFTQIVTGVPETVANQTISIWELTLAGGPLMIPLLICSIIAIYIFVERLMTINKANVNSDSFMSRIKELVQKGDINGAKILCSQHDTPVARMIEKGVNRIGSPLKNIEASI